VQINGRSHHAAKRLKKSQDIARQTAIIDGNNRDCLVALSEHQIMRYASGLNEPVSNHNGKEETIQTMRLPGVLLQMQEADPRGFYYCEFNQIPTTSDYYADSKQGGFLEGSVQLAQWCIVPSGGIEYFRRSNKVVSIDCCHLKTSFRGTICGLGMKDGNGILRVLAFAQSKQNECKDLANWFLEICFRHFPGIRLLLSDRGKAFHEAHNNMYQRASNSYVDKLQEKLSAGIDLDAYDPSDDMNSQNTVLDSPYRRKTRSQSQH